MPGPEDSQTQFNRKNGSIICLEERSCAGQYTLNGTVNILIKEDTEIIPATRKSMEPFTRNKSTV